MLEKEMEKVTKSMSQTIEFTQRLLKYSSPTEVFSDFKIKREIFFKRLLSSNPSWTLVFKAFYHSMRMPINSYVVKRVKFV